MQKLRRQRWNADDRTCHICHRWILEYSDYVLDHEKPGKMGGCKNDGEDNLKPAHIWCNSVKGSRTVEEARRLLGVEDPTPANCHLLIADCSADEGFPW